MSELLQRITGFDHLHLELPVMSTHDCAFDIMWLERLAQDYTEFYQANYDLTMDILEHPFTCDNGQATVPDGPGLGIRLDVEMLEFFSRNRGVSR